MSKWQWAGVILVAWAIMALPAGIAIGRWIAGANREPGVEEREVVEARVADPLTPGALRQLPWVESVAPVVTSHTVTNGQAFSIPERRKQQASYTHLPGLKLSVTPSTVSTASSAARPVSASPTRG